MKLDTKKTIQIGFAFLSISAFWQMYNNVIPLVLTNTFHNERDDSGAIMAADNILALFLLPLFGGISDRCKSRMGRRKPFVLFGTIAAVILMLLLPLVDNSYFTNPSDTKTILFIGILGCLAGCHGHLPEPGGGSDAGRYAKTSAQQGKRRHQSDGGPGRNYLSDYYQCALFLGADGRAGARGLFPAVSRSGGDYAGLGADRHDYWSTR